MASRRGARKTGSQRKAPSTSSTREGRGRVVAITGAFGFFGRRLIRQLEADPSVERVVAIDIRSPMELAEREGEPTDPAAYLAAHSRLSAHQLDLTAPGADRELRGILESEGADALCHLAFLSNPTHARELAHELENIGTMYVLNAVRAANVRRLLTLSTTMVYGARHDNPAWITEGHALQGPDDSRFIRDKREADLATLRFGAQHPDVKVAVARVGVVLGSGIRSFWARYFGRPLVPTVLGYDPLFQVLHADDAVRGLKAVLDSLERADAPGGAYNVVGRGVLPLGRVIKGLGRRSLPLPATVGSGLLTTLWNFQVAEMPPSFVEYLRWSWVCDGRRMREELGFVPERTTAEVVEQLSTSSLPYAPPRASASASPGSPSSPSSSASAGAASLEEAS